MTDNAQKDAKTLRTLANRKRKAAKRMKREKYFAARRELRLKLYGKEKLKELSAEKKREALSEIRKLKKYLSRKSRQLAKAKAKAKEAAVA
jgi:hypothetical protein